MAATLLHEMQTMAASSLLSLAGAAIYGPVVTGIYGPSCLDASGHAYRGAKRHSYNVGELAAICHLSEWLLANVPTGACVRICFDSMHAAKIAQQQWHAKAIIELARRAACSAKALEDHAEVSWLWVRGHSQVTGNERADLNAKAGAMGAKSPWRPTHRHSHARPAPAAALMEASGGTPQTQVQEIT